MSTKLSKKLKYYAKTFFYHEIQSSRKWHFISMHTFAFLKLAKQLKWSEFAFLNNKKQHKFLCGFEKCKNNKFRAEDKFALKVNMSSTVLTRLMSFSSTKARISLKIFPQTFNLLFEKSNKE